MKNILPATNTFTFFIVSAFLQALNAQPYFNPPNKSWATGTGPTAVIAADFNGDGKKDLATANSTGNNISIMLGTGNGNFGVPTNIAVGTGTYSLVSADFNGDLKADLAVCNNGSNNVTVLLGNGTGGFGAAAIFSVGTGPRGITSGDFNGDTKTDIATANWSGGNISVLLGNGAGSFGAATNFSAGANPRSIISSDLNGDTKADLTVANETSNNVSVLLGTGTGSFGVATNFSVGTNPRSITCADFNGDSKMDLATANASNNISVLIGTGTGSFSAATNFAAGITPYSVTNADFNSDGKIDLAVASWGSDNFTNISVLMGTGTGSFSPAKKFPSTIWTVPSNAAALTSADLNGDLKPDLAVANYAYNSVSVLTSFTPAVGSCPNPMRIVILGASTSFGFGASVFDSAYAYRFRQYIIDSINGYSELINLAHAGYTTYAMQPTGYPAPGAYPVDTLRNITKAISLNPDGVIFNYTTNDINALINADTTKNNLLRAINMLTALGIPYWITTSQPRNFTGDPVATIALKKQMILNLRDTIIKLFPLNYIESYTGFADVNGDILPQFDSGDHTHLTDAGHRKLFDNFKSAGIPGIICPMLTTTSEAPENSALVVYPNPFSETTTILFSDGLSRGVLTLYNVYGQKITTIDRFSGKSISIERGNLPAGIYFLRVTRDGKILATDKFVITDR